MPVKISHISLLGLVAIALLLSGCVSGTHVGDRYGSGGETNGKLKIESEAFLYDVKYIKAGKKNSFRLEVYLTDSLAGLAGRGYLGKGALKGWLSEDSLAIYFPTVNEHLFEPISALLSQYRCAGSTNEVNFLKLFSYLPALSNLSEGLILKIDSSNTNRPVYSIRHESCPWSLKLTYDQRSVGWRLKQFEFDDGRQTRLDGSRRKFRERAKIPQSRYWLDVPDGSVRITL